MNTQCTILFIGYTLDSLKRKIEMKKNSFEWYLDQYDDSYFFKYERDLFLDLDYTDWDLLESESEIISKDYKREIKIYEVKNEDCKQEFVAVFYRQKI